MKPLQNVRSRDSAASLELDRRAARAGGAARRSRPRRRPYDRSDRRSGAPCARPHRRAPRRHSSPDSTFAALRFDCSTTASRARGRRADGERVEAGDVIAEIEGRARALLTGERTALNLLSRLCGIATATRTLVDLVAGTQAHIADTRKTTPGLRVLERYAVRCGGGGITASVSTTAS